MGVIDSDKVRGAYIGGKVVCKDCFTDKEWDELKEDQIITEQDLEDDEKIYFCNRCKKRL